MTAPTQEVSDWLAAFGAALERADIDAATAMFAEESYWRDLVSFTWNLKTMEGRGQIADMLGAQLEHVRPTGFTIVGEANEAEGVTDGWFDFETADRARSWSHPPARRPVLDTADHDGRAQGSRGAEPHHAPRGVEHGAFKERPSWLERKHADETALGSTVQPYCVIIGGGQGGIGLGARLKQLDVPTIIIEKNPRPGDSWRNRYKSLCLHDPVWYDHLPYIKFPENWPVFSPKDKIGDWLEMYTKVMELNYWGSSECTGAAYDEDAEEWTVEVARRLDDGSTEQVVLKPKQLVLATGMSGRAERARDRRCRHVRRRHPPFQPVTATAPPTRGKQCIVLGSNNSAHDICAALWENGADVTMIQRSSTHIARSDTLMELALGDLYSERALDSGCHDRVGRPDLRLDPVPDPAHVPDPRVRGDGTHRRRLLRSAWRRRGSCSTGATTGRACS